MSDSIYDNMSKEFEAGQYDVLLDVARYLVETIYNPHTTPVERGQALRYLHYIEGCISEEVEGYPEETE